MRRRMRCWRAKGEIRARVRSGRVRWRERWAARVSSRYREREACAKWRQGGRFFFSVCGENVVGERRMVRSTAPWVREGPTRKARRGSSERPRASEGEAGLMMVVVEEDEVVVVEEEEEGGGGGLRPRRGMCCGFLMEVAR